MNEKRPAPHKQHPGKQHRSHAGRRDPRPYQIAVLSSLAVYAIFGLDFDVRPPVALAAVTAALLSQAILGRWAKLPRPLDLRSALISSLSLILLLRAASPTLAALTGLLAISSKFVLRFQGRHLFNPTALALAVMSVVSDGVWISPGQWGAAAIFAFTAAAAGVLVVHRAERADITFAFLGSFTLLVLARAAWLGDPPAIPLHQLTSGSLLVFSFFMISDPKTTPASRLGRVVFAALVATVALVIQFGFYRANGPIYALVLCAPLVPLLDRFLPGTAYNWPGARDTITLQSSPSPRKEASPCVS